ncbi:MAG: gamma-glutamylcyclotransferase [Leptolyngbyaceae cyanobacterium CRU_2_3]|nr:gamma-glutamylcyclotransferase [Leptolyngbyaceae cyanobacterium CRU_2_3]
MSELLKLFVYGTLKPGESNYEAYCAGQAVEVQEAIAYGELFDLPFDYPAMTAGDRPVYGYILSFSNAAILDDLDELEGYSSEPSLTPNEYEREEIEVFSLDGRSLGSAWVYLMSVEQAIEIGGILLADGRWTGKTLGN